MKNKVIFVEKTNIFNTSIHEENVDELSAGEVLLEIEKYALTSNNITYAVTGFQVKYWKFFPAPDQWGIVPVWGFAKVVQSKNDEIEVGEQVYGYFPMGKYLKINGGKVSSHSFMDISAHRQELAPIYNTYNRLGKEKDYPPGTEDYIPIVKPLFVTSFLIYQFLKTENFFAAEEMIITSASSKTSLGLAYMLSENRNEHGKKIIGLTSKGNLDFVKETGFYDEVIPYDNVDDSIRNIESVIIDMAGNGQLLWNIYQKLDKQLKHVCKIGLTDWTKASMDNKIPVAKFFFAPTYAQAFFKEHGPKEANKMIMAAMFSFIKKASEWTEISHINSYEDLQNMFVAMAKGKVDPSKGYVMVN